MQQPVLHLRDLEGTPIHGRTHRGGVRGHPQRPGPKGHQRLGDDRRGARAPNSRHSYPNKNRYPDQNGKQKKLPGIPGIKYGFNETQLSDILRGYTFRCQVLEKRNETWQITWLPNEVKNKLKELSEHAKKNGGYYFNFSYPRLYELRTSWIAVTKKHIGIELTFHDLRSVSITWLFVMGVPLEIATNLNVGWRDLSTVRDHYLDMRALLKKSEREAYRANIPEWYKDGLDEY